MICNLLKDCRNYVNVIKYSDEKKNVKMLSSATGSRSKKKTPRHILQMALIQFRAAAAPPPSPSF